MRFLHPVTAALLTLGASAEHVQHMIRRGDVKVRGVNLGSWLVGEHWMSYESPAWEGLDTKVARMGEFKAMEALGHAKGDAQFDQHRRTWITRDDIEEIAKYGLNTVRVPVGYWIVNDDPSTYHSEASKVYAPGGLKYLDKLVKEWALDLNVSVMLSLHAHQGSQNGYDHSAPPVFGEKFWADNPENVESSLQF